MSDDAPPDRNVAAVHLALALAKSNLPAKATLPIGSPAYAALRAQIEAHGFEIVENNGHVTISFVPSDPKT